MRKSIVAPSGTHAGPSSSDQWLDLENIASVEISSEDAQHPFEDAFQGGRGEGWRAAVRPQVIRLNFDKPQPIRRIRLQFREERMERAQEYAMFASSATHPSKEVVRQQWAFSPGGSTTELEDYHVNLAAVLTLELQIDPGRHDKQMIATLESIAIA